MSGNGIVWSTQPIRLGDLVEWERNPVQLSEHDAKEIEKSLRKFGLVLPLVANAPLENGRRRLIDGHQRKTILTYARMADSETMLDVRVPDRLLSEKECDELSIRLRRNSGEWNWDLLSSWDTKELLDFGFEPLDFQMHGIQLDGDGEPVEDAGAQVDRASELLEIWKVKPGDLWQLGAHKLICGDCTDRVVVGRVMGGEKADLVSDPPYGIGYEYSDHDDKDNTENEQLVRSAWAVAPEGAKIWTCGLMNLSRDLAWNPDVKVLCWHKGFAHAGSGLGGASTWEPVLVLDVKGGTLPDNYLDFKVDRILGLHELHPCPKPISLFEHLIQHLAGETIYDPFLGSGTTLIACERLHRKCHAIEISPKYCAVALQRWADSTGKTPVLLDR